jgi:hypothetical protein
VGGGCFDSPFDRLRVAQDDDFVKGENRQRRFLEP